MSISFKKHSQPSLSLSSTSMDVESWLCALFNPILYKALKVPYYYLPILLSMGVLKSIPLGYQGTTKVLGKSKVILGFSTAWGPVLLTRSCSRVNCNSNLKVMNNKLHNAFSLWEELLINCKTIQKVSELLNYWAAKLSNKWYPQKQ